MKTLKMLIKTAHRKVLKTSNLAYINVASTETNFAKKKKMAFYVPIGCVRFERYCGKMYSRPSFSLR